MKIDRKIKDIFDKIPFRNKIIGMQLLTIFIALFFSTAGSVYIYKKIAEEELRNQIKSTAHTIAENTGAAVLFFDKSSAEKTLQTSLDEHKNILSACLYNHTRELFVFYNLRENQNENCNERFNSKEKFVSSKDMKKISFSTQVIYANEIVGYLSLVSDRQEIKESTLKFFEIAIYVFFFVMIFSLYLSFKAQKVIMNPVGQLTKSVQKVLNQKDYSLTIEHSAKDELGILAKEFNEMLYEIQKRENILKKSRDQLEKKVIQRTADLQKATEKAIQASKAKSQFLAKMSHEIRTPMNAILGFAEILSEELKKNKNIKYISYILSSANTLLNIIDDILDLSKVEAGKIEVKENFVNLKKIFEDVARLFSGKINQKKLKLIITHDIKLPNIVLLDEIRIRQILINLTSNAIKFTDKGSIELSTKIEKGNENFQKNLILTVKDSGIGIPKDQQKKIFEEFTQKDNQDHAQYGGTGLGLAIIKQLAMLMNGYVTVKSQEGKGSEFSVCLRDVFIVRDKTINKKLKRQKNDKIKIKEGKILIVDDVDGNRTLLKAYLKDQKLSIIEAENGREAVEKTKKEIPDIILMDLKMPVMNGDEAIELIKKDQKTKNIPILVLTASGMKSDEERLKLNCDGYLTKPIRKKDLLSEIIKYL
ncbi:MAG: ATP-binding protein [Spirochaetia bacterium]|nr:ATP-binding protein [Spirochaetia bacterium]